MKTLIKIVLILLVIIILAIGGLSYYLVKNADKFIAKFKPQIEETLSEALDAKVTLGDISVSIFPDFVLNLAELEIKKDGAPAGLKLKDLTLDVDLASFNTEHLKIKRLSLKKPELTFVKDKSGVSLEGLPKGSGVKKTSTKTKPKKQTPEQGQVEKSGGMSKNTAISLESLSIEDANIRFKDLLSKKEYSVKSFNLLTAILLSESKINFRDFRVSGLALGKAQLETHIPNLNYSFKEGGVDLGELVFAIVQNAFKIKGNYSVPKKSGSFNVNANALDLERFNALLSFFAPNFKFGPAPAKLNLDVNLNGSAIDIPNSELNIFSGTVKNKANINQGAFKLVNTIEKINLEELNKGLKPDEPAKVNGTLESANLKLNGNLSAIPASLSGDGDLLVKDGALIGNNLAASVLDLVKDLPSLSGSLLDAAPENLRGEIEGEDTPIRMLNIIYAIKDKALNVKDLKLESTIFNLTGRGFIKFDTSMDLEAEIVFNKEFSEALAVKVKEIEKVLDNDGQLVVPLTIQGKLPKLVLLPNLSELVKRGATKQIEKKIEEKAGKLLEKAFGF